MAKRKTFTTEQKLRAVAAVEAGRPRKEVAAKLQTSDKNVYRWCQEYPRADLLLKAAAREAKTGCEEQRGDATCAHSLGALGCEYQQDHPDGCDPETGCDFEQAEAAIR